MQTVADVNSWLGEDVKKDYPDNAHEFMIMCNNDEDCSAYDNGLISVVSINWLVSCLCCGKRFDSAYFDSFLKKHGLLD